MQIDKWAATVRLTVVDGTDPVTMSLEVGGQKVKAEAMAESVGAAVQKQLAQMGEFTARDRAELASLRKRVALLDEANAAAKAADAAATERARPEAPRGGSTYANEPKAKPKPRPRKPAAK